MFSGSFSLQKPAQRLKPFTPAWLGPQPGTHRNAARGSGMGYHTLHHHESMAALPDCDGGQHCTRAAVTCIRKAQRLILNSFCQASEDFTSATGEISQVFCFPLSPLKQRKHFITDLCLVSASDNRDKKIKPQTKKAHSCSQHFLIFATECNL